MGWAGRSDDVVEAGKLAELNRVLADGGGSTEDDGGLTLADLVAVLVPRSGEAETALVVQTGVDGHTGYPEGSRLFVGYLLGRLGCKAGGDLDVLLEGRRVVLADDALEEDSLADFMRLDRGADSDDFSGSVGTEHGRELGDEDSVVTDLPVDRVDGSCGDLDGNLVGREWRQRAVDHFVLGPGLGYHGSFVRGWQRHVELEFGIDRGRADGVWEVSCNSHRS